MSVDLERRPDRIETGRTWRDLPPEPPQASPRRRVEIPLPEYPVPPRTKRRRRIWVMAAVVAVAALAVWASWRLSQPVPAPRVASAPPATAILPPALEAPTPTGGGFSFLDFFDGSQDPFRDNLDLIDVRGLPDGFELRRSIVGSSNSARSEQLTIVGPAGTVSVRAIRGEGATPPREGEPIEVDGFAGRLVDGDPVTLSWMDNRETLLILEAPAAVERGVLLAIASAIVVLP